MREKPPTHKEVAEEARPSRAERLLSTMPQSSTGNGGRSSLSLVSAPKRYKMEAAASSISFHFGTCPKSRTRVGRKMPQK